MSAGSPAAEPRPPTTSGSADPCVRGGPEADTRRAAILGSEAVRTLAAILVAAVLTLSGAGAHDAIEPEAAEALLDRVAALGAAARDDRPPRERGAALYALGVAVARIRDELNRALAAHGGKLGLVSSLLERELRARGIALELSPATKRYKSYLEPFVNYLVLSPVGPEHADAQFRVLSGRFYDSFVSDPFRPLDLDLSAVVAQMIRAEALLRRYPDHPERQEVLFILAVDRMRAAKAVADAASAEHYLGRARAALDELERSDPNDMRALAVRMLLESFTAGER